MIRSLDVLRYRARDRVALLRTKYMLDFIFVHINKTGGSSIEVALKLPFQHLTAVELRDHLGQRRWESRFRFAFVRNPWSKVASHYAYRVQTNQTGLGGGRPAFNEWVRLAYGERDPRFHDQPKMFMAQNDWICDEGGTLLVDFVGRFERLADDFAEVCRRVGRRAELPHLKRSAGRDYRSLYTDETAGIVAQRFAADVERFGYAFDVLAG
jgi:chondroitin 4-sulfotransferase 11